MAATPKQIAANKKNAKKGGRPVGALSATTLDRIKVNKEIQQLAMRDARFLYTKKLQLAAGQGFLYKIEKYYEGEGKNRKLKHKPPKLVTEKWEFDIGLEEALKGGLDFEDRDQTYYYFTTKEPNNQAITDLLDRGIGTVIQKIGTEDEEGNTQPITGMLIVMEGKKKKDGD